MEKFTTWEDKSCGINPFVPYKRRPRGVAGSLLGCLLVLIRLPLLAAVAVLLALGVALEALVLVWPLRALVRVAVLRPAAGLALACLGFFGASEAVPDARRLRLGKLSKQGLADSQQARAAFGSTVRAGDVVLFNHTSVVEVLYLYARFGAVFALVSLPDGARLRSAGLLAALARASFVGADPTLAPCNATAAETRSIRELQAEAAAQGAPLAVAAEGVRSNGLAVLEFADAVRNDATLADAATRVHIAAFDYAYESWAPPNTTRALPAYLLWSFFQPWQSLLVHLVPFELRTAQVQARQQQQQQESPRESGEEDDKQGGSEQVEKMRGMLAATVGNKGVKQVALGIPQYFSFLEYFVSSSSPSSSSSSSSSSPSAKPGSNTRPESSSKPKSS